MLTPPTQALLCCVSGDTKGARKLWGENLIRIGENFKAQSNMLLRMARIKLKARALSSNKFASSHPPGKGIKENNMSNSKKSSLTHASLS